LRTRLRLRDELITEQNLSNYFDIGIKTHYQEVIQLRYFQEMSCTRNDFHLLFAFWQKLSTLLPAIYNTLMHQLLSFCTGYCTLTQLLTDAASTSALNFSIQKCNRATNCNRFTIPHFLAYLCVMGFSIVLKLFLMLDKTWLLKFTNVFTESFKSLL
jgi:hypothetical protein